MKYKDCPSRRTCLQGETQCLDAGCDLNRVNNKKEHEQHVEGLSNFLHQLIRERDKEKDNEGGWE